MQSFEQNHHIAKNVSLSGVGFINIYVRIHLTRKSNGALNIRRLHGESPRYDISTDMQHNIWFRNACASFPAVTASVIIGVLSSSDRIFM